MTSTLRAGLLAPASAARRCFCWIRIEAPAGGPCCVPGGPHGAKNPGRGRRHPADLGNRLSGLTARAAA